jgi:hypothetical protein
VDAHLRVVGAPLGTVYALGDAATVRLGYFLYGWLGADVDFGFVGGQIETSVVSHILELVDEADKNKDGKIDYNEWQVMGASIRARVMYLCTDFLPLFHGKCVPSQSRKSRGKSPWPHRILRQSAICSSGTTLIMMIA